MFYASNEFSVLFLYFLRVNKEFLQQKHPKICIMVCKIHLQVHTLPFYIGFKLEQLLRMMVMKAF